jgi:aspartyl/asparaginyl beta-hydroxylase
MNIDQPLKDLGPVDMQQLQAEVLGLDDETWLVNSSRQNTYEVHKQTRSVVLVFCDGPAEKLEVSKTEGWDKLAAVAVPLMHDIIRRCYSPGGTIIRAMAANLPSGTRINPHFDAHATFRRSHRIHIPITTNPRVRFMIDGKPFQLQVGRAYEINNQKTHSVMNSGKEDRMTFIFDYMPRDFIASSVSV